MKVSVLTAVVVGTTVGAILVTMLGDIVSQLQGLSGL